MRTSVATIWVGVLALAVAGACGGSQKSADDPVQEVADDDPESEEPVVDEVMVPSEKFDELNRTMSRRRPRVSRCYADAIEHGHIQPTTKGELTVGLTVTEVGKASNVKILQSSFKSKVVETCVLEEIRRATFTTLPKPVEFSFTYRFERDY